MAIFSEETKLAVWKKAQVVSNNDPAVWRKDQCGAWIGWAYYGDRARMNILPFLSILWPGFGRIRGFCGHRMEENGAKSILWQFQLQVDDKQNHYNFIYKTKVNYISPYKT